MLGVRSASLSALFGVDEVTMTMTKRVLNRRELIGRAAALTTAAVGLGVGGRAGRPGRTGVTAAALPDDVLLADATAVRAALRDRRLSAVELTRMCFDRIDEVGPLVNAVVLRRQEEALREAATADARLAHGDTAPLLGLPVTLKESFDLAGLPTTWGLADFAGGTVVADSAAAAAYRGAGAILLGKTNVPVGLSTYDAENPVYGRTVNPYDPGRTPGGSSGGAAAALATGQTCLECGSDLGGSIRQPAHSCGVFGLKPTCGVVSQRGHAPPTVPRRMAGVLDSPTVSQMPVVGPLARSARDLRLALEVLGGPRGPEARAYTWSLPEPRAKRLRDFRVGYVLDHPSAPVEDTVGTMLESVIVELERRGVALRAGWPAGVDPDRQRDLRFYHRAALEAFAPTEELEQRMREAAEGPRFPAGDWRGLVDRGLADPLPDRMRYEIERLEMRARWDEAFHELDVFLCPVQSQTAFPHGGVTEDAVIPNHLWWAAGTIIGLPCAVAPLGLAADGLPVGLQILGPMYADSTPIAFAEALEEAGLAMFVPPDDLSIVSRGGGSDS